MARQSYPGNVIRITFLGGIRSRFTNATITHSREYNDRQFLGSDVTRRSRKSQDLEIELEFENSNDLNSANLIAGLPIESFDILGVDADGTTTESMINPDIFDDFPVNEMEIGELEMEYPGDDNSTISVTIVTNVDDLVAA